MNRVNQTKPSASPNLEPLMDDLKTRGLRFLNAFRNPYNYLAGILAIAAVIVFFVDVKGSIVSIGIAYMVAMLRLQLTRRHLERQRLEIAEDQLSVTTELLEIMKKRQTT